MGVTAVWAESVNWQEAVATLTRERTLAETCAGLLKRHGDTATQARLSVTYGEAKAEYDGVIGGLAVALARGNQPDSLTDLQARLQRGFDKRDAFCRAVEPLLPKQPGEKGVIADIVGAVVKPVLDAVVLIWKEAGDRDELMRKTIQSQLEATKWAAFDEVPPSALP
jgi:hypothetical protein